MDAARTLLSEAVGGTLSRCSSLCLGPIGLESAPSRGPPVDETTRTRGVPTATFRVSASVGSGLVPFCSSNCDALLVLNFSRSNGLPERLGAPEFALESKIPLGWVAKETRSQSHAHNQIRRSQSGAYGDARTRIRVHGYFS